MMPAASDQEYRIEHIALPPAMDLGKEMAGGHRAGRVILGRTPAVTSITTTHGHRTANKLGLPT